MPRVSTKLIREAKKVSPLLPYFLRANASLDQAKRELQWVQSELPENQWIEAAKRRHNHEPLQYILKSQPFGSLDIICEQGVLIPRWETEEWCLKLSSVLSVLGMKNLNILDSCSGTGCIPLLLNYELNQLANLNSRIKGFDLSPTAHKLSNKNLHSYTKMYPSSASNVSFAKADLFSSSLLSNLDVRNVDLVTSNPPYIPPKDYNNSVVLNGISRSVRNFEPSLALIGENEFYEALITNLVLPSKAKGFIFELGYQEQADNVHKLMKTRNWNVGLLKDSASNIRCVIGWKDDSPMSALGQLCTFTYE
ncbi:S-adenosyl-L-methionine-dependent methyltransferase [Scheffersomyces coipomensis]|uniref:S-adenosyl-L-methionine-dependent methyltransferase n=1 Tax=Scheffersomyces coipomensis TaxID=1788519 RepID=UPI00315DD5EC